MSEPIWVCGRWNTAPKEIEKLKVMHEGAHTYHVEWDGIAYSIPKDHYIPCPAPEQWERVEVFLDKRSANRTAVLEGPIMSLPPIAEIYCADSYRVVSLVVERRKS